MNKRRPATTALRLLCALTLIATQAFAQAAVAQASSIYRISPSIKSIAALKAQLSSMTQGLVIRIVDGDTIVVSFNAATGLGLDERVRLIGVNTPETVDPRKPVERFGKEAALFAEERLLNRTVLLAFDPKLRDYYGRLLAYVFLEDGSLFNLAIVAEGYGFAYTKYPFPFMEEFRKAERGARERKKGLWGQ
jgi:micrococcal nuclease